MNPIKNELQNSIIGNGQDGNTSQLKNVQNFLRGNVQAGERPEEQKHIKSEEEAFLIGYAEKESLFFLMKFQKNYLLAKEQSKEFTVLITTV